MFKFLKEEAFGITRRIIHRDFRGNTGLAVKNSIYQFGTNVVGKVGSLIFVAILAKSLLSVELFGLYSLALSTILVFAGFADLGIANTLVRFVSKYHQKPQGYINYLAKMKIVLTSIVIVVLIASSYFIANYYYEKPIFLALLAGALYLAVASVISFISSIFQAENNFKILFYREILFQVLKLIIVPAAILFFLVYSTPVLLASIILSLAVSYAVLIFLLRPALKKQKGMKLNKKQKADVKSFALPLSLLVLSGVFFGYVDTIMLGHYVTSEFIAYYQAAFSLLSSVIVLLSFNSVLFPIFSRISGKKLLTGFKKALFIMIPLSLIGIIGTIIFAPRVIQLIYNANYGPAVNILKLLSLVLLFEPFIGIYSGYFMAQGKSKLIASVLIASTIINIILNYILINVGLSYSQYHAVLGATMATVISKAIYLGLFMLSRRKLKQL